MPPSAAEDRLLSVGIDIGTTTTHLVLTSLKFGNRARPTHISQLGITDREILFESPIYETPLTGDGRINAEAVAKIVQDVYLKAAKEANLDMTAVQTGAVIITGESARTRNARAIVEKVAKFAGEFVVESAGPGLESIFCARGSGAQARSKEQGKRILALDIGGGTSNFAWIKDGEIAGTGALSIGGRAVRFSSGKISRMSQSAALLCRSHNIDLKVGAPLDQFASELARLAELMAALLCDLCAKGGHLSDQLSQLWLTPVLTLDRTPETILFSGGVAALMQSATAADAYIDDRANEYQDFGIYLARALNQLLRQRKIKFEVADKAIRATVLGAGMHTLQLSGSTIDFAIDCLPLRNLPLIKIDGSDQKHLAANIRKAIELKQIDWSKQPVALSLVGLDRNQLQYTRVKHLAETLAQVQEEMQAAEPLVVTYDQDIAMVLGQLLKRLVPDKRIISVDGLVIEDGDYLDIGKPVHSNSLSDRYTHSLPLVVKTLIFYKN